MGKMLNAIQQYLLKRLYGESELIQAEDTARSKIENMLSGAPQDQDFQTTDNYTSGDNLEGILPPLN